MSTSISFVYLFTYQITTSYQESYNNYFNLQNTISFLLGNKEIEELKNLILTLGKSDIESQQRMIDLSIENLKKQTYETKEDINKKGVLYKKLVTFIGIGICIILI